MNAKTQSLIMVASRVLMALLFILSGVGKIDNPEAIRGYMEAMHLPAVLLWPSVVFEIGSGLLLIMGFKTRIVALLLAGYCIVTATIFHTQFSDQVQMAMFFKNVTMAGGFLLLAAVGAGGLSVDARRNSAQ
ncbi:DoxX family protein [Pseudomonas lactis]|uniref:DoxX family protein n=1 Tax=Pseudomonas lactis TaxID=1615674 RepID=A0A7Y1LB54_9PSED|nr:DoxX family protein [Pseudomonas lactis]NNA42875.1 DoxX family protein [Pseudomonas lactis]